MINNSMEDVASKFGDDWGRLAGDMPILAEVCEICLGCVSCNLKIDRTRCLCNTSKNLTSNIRGVISIYHV